MMLAAGRLQFPDYFILIGYFVLILGIGAYFYRYMRRMKDYFSGGNNIPWWLSGVSYYMSCFSAFGFIAYSALAFEFGWVAVSLFWVMAPATIVTALFMSRRWRRARIDSPVEYLEARYSPQVRQLFAWQGIPVRIIDDALKLVAIGVFIKEGLGLETGPAMFWSGLIMLAYTFMGGLWAVTVTDFVQFIVMVAAIVVLLPLSISAAGGMSEFIQNSPEGFFRWTSEEYSWVYLCVQVFLFCLAFSSVNWALIQRLYCVPKEKDAVKVGWLVFVLSIIGPPLILLPAMAASRFLTGVEDTNEVYPKLCVQLLPAGMLGLIIAAMFSATMSMLSSDYNVAASVLTNDVYRRYIEPGASQRRLVWVGRLMTLLVGLIALGTAFLLAEAKGDELFRNMVKLFSVATAPVAIPMIAGLITPRVTKTAALASFLAGLSAGIAAFFLCPDKFELFGAMARKENGIVLTTTFVTVLWMVVVSWLDRRFVDETEQDRVDGFLRRLDVPIGEAEEDQLPVSRAGSAAISPFSVVGVSTAIIGVMMLLVLPWVEGRLAVGMSLGIGLALVVLGAVMTIGSRRRSVPGATSS